MTWQDWFNTGQVVFDVLLIWHVHRLSQSMDEGFDAVSEYIQDAEGTP